MTLNRAPGNVEKRNPPVRVAIVAPGSEKPTITNVCRNKGGDSEQVVRITEGEERLAIFAKGVKAQIVFQEDRAQQGGQRDSS